MSFVIHSFVHAKCSLLVHGPLCAPLRTAFRAAQLAQFPPRCLAHAPQDAFQMQFMSHRCVPAASQMCPRCLLNGMRYSPDLLCAPDPSPHAPRCIPELWWAVGWKLVGGGVSGWKLVGWKKRLSASCYNKKLFPTNRPRAFTCMRLQQKN